MTQSDAGDGPALPTRAARQRRGATARAAGRWFLRAGLPLLTIAAALLGTAWQIGSQLELTREAAERESASEAYVRMLRAGSDYQSAADAHRRYVEVLVDREVAESDFMEDAEYRAVVGALYDAHDEVANARNEMLLYGDPEAIAASEALIDAMPHFVDGQLFASPAYALAHDRLIRVMCLDLNPDPVLCGAVKALR